MPLVLLSHPLAAHLVTRLRDKRTAGAEFRRLARQLTTMLLIEATRDLPLASEKIETPLEPHEGKRLAARLVGVPILRAGLGMLEPLVELFPEVDVGYIGLERSHDGAAVARRYYEKLPPLAGRRVLVLDPMLATGGSAVHAIARVLEAGAESCTLVCVIAAPEGVAAVASHFPYLTLYATALDRELDARKYILPGIGDFGDRLYGTL